MMVDLEYGIIRIIWWVILNILFIGFAVMEGYDMGSAGLLSFLGKNNEERRLIINSIGPYWEGNQVWLVLSLGAMFAAFPLLYGAIASGIYFGFLIILYTLVMRPISFKFRKKIDANWWRNLWDIALSLSGFIPPLIFGLMMGSMYRGFNYNVTTSMYTDFSGSGFLDIFSPLGIVIAFLVYFLFMSQGASYLNVKVLGNVANRSHKLLPWSTLISLLLFIIYFISLFSINGYQITSPIDIGGPSNPLNKSVIIQPGAWISNYYNYKILFIFPIVTLLVLLLQFILSFKKLLTRGLAMFIMILNSIAIAGFILTWATTLFPFLYPSITHPNVSLTLWDSSSSLWTLWVMLISVIIFLPIILFYTWWLIHKLRGPLEIDHSKGNQSNDDRIEY